MGLKGRPYEAACFFRRKRNVALGAVKDTDTVRRFGGFEAKYLGEGVLVDRDKTNPTRSSPIRLSKTLWLARSDRDTKRPAVRAGDCLPRRNWAKRRGRGNGCGATVCSAHLPGLSG
jgi:hypothetical protein